MEHVRFSSFLIAFLLTLCMSSGYAQDTVPSVVKWHFKTERNAESIYTLEIEADIKPGWKLFSTSMPEDQPNSRVTLDSSVKFASITNISEANVKSAREPLFD